MTKMDEELHQICPACDATAVPYLVVRPGVDSNCEFSWRCRTCQSEWPVPDSAPVNPSSQATSTIGSSWTPKGHKTLLTHPGSDQA